MLLRILSVNTGRVQTYEHQGKMISTAIFKEPEEGPVFLGRTGLTGDEQADTRHHGGEDMAVYAYTLENYGIWSRELDRKNLSYGTFGENLTMESMLDETVSIGDIYAMGGARVQVTQPRTPCSKLGFRMELASFPKQMMETARTGFYMRVLQEGEVEAGDTVHLQERYPDSLTVKQTFRALHSKPQQAEALSDAMGSPGLSEEWQGFLMDALEKL